MSYTAYDGSVHVRYLDLEPSQGLARVVARAAALIETAQEMAAARTDDEETNGIVNPWQEPVPPATAVNDPWANERADVPELSEQAQAELARRRTVQLHVHTEVLDPWAGTESGVPTTPTHALRPHSEVLDPWADERNAETLRAFEDSPRGRETGDHLTPPRS